MKLLLKNAYIYSGNSFSVGDLFISDGRIVSADNSFTPDTVIDCSNKYVFPGFADVHVHLREPGFSYKETIKSGSAAAARGGFTTVCTMPNLKPSPDGAEGLEAQLEIIRRDAVIDVRPVGAITKGSRGEELADLGAMAEAAAFSDDGVGTTPDILTAAMKKAIEMGKVICSHCEDATLKGGNHIAAGSPWCEKLGIEGIRNESEFVQLEREIKCAEETGCPYHLCHTSCAESIELIRDAKARGVDVTCETAPHYFVFDYTMIDADDAKYKMNPPLRSPRDREAVIQGICDGTVEIIATDHAPHSAEEKGKGLCGSMMGVVGLETSFAASYTHLVRTGKITLARLVELMSVNPRKRLGLGGGSLAVGEIADLTVFDIDKEFTVDPEEFLTMGRSTPFASHKLYGECLLTVCGGRIVYKK